jgi:uncharacterized membrane protein
MDDRQDAPPVSQDEKLWAALSYLLWPFVPIIVLMNNGKRQQSTLRYHAVQALVAGIVLALAIWLVLAPTMGCGSVIWLLMFYWALRVYRAESVSIPVITSFLRQRDWV